MSRTKGGVKTRKRHKRVLKAARGFYAGRRKYFTAARETLDRARYYAYAGRKLKKPRDDRPCPEDQKHGIHAPRQRDGDRYCSNNANDDIDHLALARSKPTAALRVEIVGEGIPQGIGNQQDGREMGTVSGDRQGRNRP